MGTFLSRYNEKLEIENLLNRLTINTVKEDMYCLITLRTCQTDANPSIDFVFMNKEQENRELFYMYDCVF